MRIGFTLLHYNNIEVTKCAVKYINELNYKDRTLIVIVDNCSPNGSGKELEEFYKGSDNIHVLLNTENVGFAKGNNVGYLYAKSLGCDTIVVMNSDVFIEDKYFCRTLENLLSKQETDVIAPRIVTENGDQNPFREDRLRNINVIGILIYNICLSVLYKLPKANGFVSSLLDKRQERIKKIKRGHDSESKKKIWAPHGSCVIYTDNWICKEDAAFLPYTFMYMEEDILAEYIYEKKYKICYAEDLKVYHAEDASVNSAKKTSLSKRKFISACMVSSSIELLKIRLKHKF